MTIEEIKKNGLSFGPFITITGVGQYSYEDEWSSDTTEGVCISFLDDGRGPEKYLYCELDKNDGYRSFGNYHTLDKLTPNVRLFPIAPAQECTIQFFSETVTDEYCGYSERNCWIEIRKYDGDELVLKIGTMNYDDYYPLGVFEYHPEAFGEIQLNMPNC